MFGGNILVLETVGFLIGEIDNAFYTRGNEDLSCPTSKNVGFRAGSQSRVKALHQGIRADIHLLKDLGNYAPWLFDQRQKDMFCINLIMAVTLDNFCRALGGLLGTFGKSVKSHHRLKPPQGWFSPLP